jgi:pimeloyl-ACP methyl ester carboxylesterase
MTETARSADGTTIAFERTGSGPPLVLVGGAFSNRRGADFLTPFLTGAFTVVAFDRRGRGDSGDTPPYAVEREIEDLHALVAAVGGTAGVYGHSSGAVLSLLATAAGLPVTKLAVYEPPFMLPGTREIPSPEYAARVQVAIDAGDRATAAETFFREAVQLPEPMLQGMQASPAWPGMLAVAHTIPYDNAIVGDASLPLAQLARIAVPTLAIAGGASPEWAQASVAALAEAVPGARHVTLPGQTHQVDGAVLAPVLLEFFGLPGPSLGGTPRRTAVRPSSYQRTRSRRVQPRASASWVTAGLVSSHTASRIFVRVRSRRSAPRPATMSTMTPMPSWRPSS